jgi:hypothetical protein
MRTSAFTFLESRESVIRGFGGDGGQQLNADAACGSRIGDLVFKTLLAVAQIAVQASPR